MTTGISAVTPTEAGHLASIAYKRKGYELLDYLYSHLPGWEWLGSEPWHHRNVVVLGKGDTVAVCITGNTPFSWRNLGKSHFYHTWGRSILNQIWGSNHDYDRFNAEMIQKYGKISLWVPHSGACFEVYNLKPDGEVIYINPQLPDGARLGPNEYGMRTHDDALTNDFIVNGKKIRDQSHIRNQLADIGPGRHGMHDVKEALAEADWDMIFPDRLNPIIAKDTPIGPKVLLPKSEYPDIHYQSKEELHKAIYKKLKAELYEQYRAEELEKILKKTSNPSKIGEKIDKVYDDYKDHPVDSDFKRSLKNQAYDSVRDDAEYIEGCSEIDRKNALDRRITEGQLELVDTLPEIPKVPGLLDNVMSTGVMYGVSAGIMTFSVGTLTLIYQLFSNKSNMTYEQIWKKAKKRMLKIVDEATKTGIEIGIVASVGQVASNGLEIVGYGFNQVIPLTLQAWQFTKVVWSYSGAPVVKAVQIDIRPYLAHMRPRKPLSIEDIDGITGKVLREHAARIARGEMDPENEEEDIYLLTKQAMSQQNWRSA